jgi:hypothetical protein
MAVDDLAHVGTPAVHGGAAPLVRPHGDLPRVQTPLGAMVQTPSGLMAPAWLAQLGSRDGAGGDRDEAMRDAGGLMDCWGNGSRLHACSRCCASCMLLLDTDDVSTVQAVLLRRNARLLVTGQPERTRRQKDRALRVRGLVSDVAAKHGVLPACRVLRPCSSRPRALPRRSSLTLQSSQVPRALVATSQRSRARRRREARHGGPSPLRVRRCGVQLLAGAVRCDCGTHCGRLQHAPRSVVTCRDFTPPAGASRAGSGHTSVAPPPQRRAGLRARGGAGAPRAGGTAAPAPDSSPTPDTAAARDEPASGRYEPWRPASAHVLQPTPPHVTEPPPAGV